MPCSEELAAQLMQEATDSTLPKTKPNKIQTRSQRRDKDPLIIEDFSDSDDDYGLYPSELLTVAERNELSGPAEGHSSGIGVAEEQVTADDSPCSNHQLSDNSAENDDAEADQVGVDLANVPGEHIRAGLGNGDPNLENADADFTEDGDIVDIVVVVPHDIDSVNADSENSDSKFENTDAGSTRGGEVVDLVVVLPTDDEVNYHEHNDLGKCYPNSENAVAGSAEDQTVAVVTEDDDTGMT